jgi:hypothetical protein
MQWHFGQREPATTPTPEPHEYSLSRYYCGAQDITSTGSKHRRRNRNPAWLLAPRTAPHLGDEEGNLAKAGIFARNQEGKCSPTSRDVLVVLFSLHRALGRGREKIAEGAGQCFRQMDEFAVGDPSCSAFNFGDGIAPDIPTDALALGC